MPFGALAGASFVVVLAAAMPARAGIRVAWSGPPGCDDGARLRERLGADLGDGVDSIAADVDVRVVAERGSWRAHLRVDGPVSLQRELTASSCTRVADAAAIVTVVAIDPFVLAPRVAVALAPTQLDVVPEPTLPAAEADAGVVAANPARAAVPAARLPRRRELAGALRVELGGWGYAMPGLGVALGLVPLLDVGRLRVELPVRWRTPSVRPVQPGVSVRTQQLAVGPRLCGVPRRGAIGVALCGGAEAGFISARGRGPALARDRLSVRPWASVTGAVAVDWRVHRRFALWLGLEGALALVRPAFHVVEAADAFRVGPATLFVAVGAELRFPR